MALFAIDLLGQVEHRRGAVVGHFLNECGHRVVVSASTPAVVCTRSLCPRSLCPRSLCPRSLCPRSLRTAPASISRRLLPIIRHLRLGARSVRPWRLGPASRCRRCLGGSFFLGKSLCGTSIRPAARCHAAR